MNIICTYVSVFCFVNIINQSDVAYEMHIFCTLYHFISEHLGLTPVFDVMEGATSPEHSNSELNLLLEVS